MFKKAKYLLLLAPLMMTACTSVPTGPTVNVMPGKDSTFEQFKADDETCRDYAEERAGDPDNSQSMTTLKNAAVTAAVGALAGAALDHGHGRSAAVGAGAGLILGTLGGAGASGEARRDAQVKYDNAYTQCMYAKGHDVPFSGKYRNQEGMNRSSYGPPPHSTTPPPDDYVVDDAPRHRRGQRSDDYDEPVRKTPRNGDYVYQEN